MRVVDPVIAVTWLAFWVYWLAAAAGTKPALTGATGFLGMRVVAVIVVIALIRAHVLKGPQVTVHNPWMEGVGLAVFLLGLGLAVWARLFLGQNWGTPMSQKQDPELVTGGPYRFVRHPIYSGILLAMIGTAIAVALYWLAVAVIMGVYFGYSATVEERNMARVFPQAYPAYKRATKMLVPFVF
jgi:protein-S-isoprenylcysteine O-methyltransferase Ste14